MPAAALPTAVPVLVPGSMETRRTPGAITGADATGDEEAAAGAAAGGSFSPSAGAVDACSGSSDAAACFVSTGGDAAGAASAAAGAGSLSAPASGAGTVEGSACSATGASPNMASSMLAQPDSEAPASKTVSQTPACVPRLCRSVIIY